jgi:hypothetical protein
VTELDRLPFEKPARRITDKRALDLYARLHPRCEVIGCGVRRLGWLEVHHLVSRKMGGSDIPGNLLRLCAGGTDGGHHGEWHRVGGREWFRRHESKLTDEARAKVAAALRIVE